MSSAPDLRRVVEHPRSGESKFPATSYPLASGYLGDYLKELARAAGTIDEGQVERAAAILSEAHARRALIFSCGNGGSASIANHMQCDHSLGIRRGTDLFPRGVSLSANVELLTALANDLGYEHVFVHQLQSQSRPGDVLVAISSSGKSQNIVQALQWARDNGLRTIAFTGFDGGGARDIAEVAVHVDCRNYGVVEDLHQALMHSLAQYVRQSRMDAGTILGTIF